MSEAVRFGVVGTGHWAREVHIAGIAAHPDVELVGVWGRDLTRAREAADPHGAAAYDDVDALLADVDAVAFAVPPHVQADLALKAARAGRHLLLEKPVATDLGAADRLVEAVDASGVSSLVFFTQRFVPDWEGWLETVASRQLLGGRAAWLASLRGPGNPYAGSVWRKEEGALWDVGPHALSVLLPVLGPVADVEGVRGADDLVHLVLTHESGATSTVDLSLTMPVAAVRHWVEVYDDEGWHVRPSLERDTAAAYALAVGELVAGIAAGETRHRCDVRFGRDVVEVLARCEDRLAR